MNVTTCPICKKDNLRPVFALWQIYLSVFLFPVGLLSLLSGKKGFKCSSCGKRITV